MPSFAVKPPTSAGKPDPVKNCSTANVTTTSFHLACEPGFNGGLPQNFTVEVVENGGAMDKVVFSDRRARPEFAVTGLRDSTDYRVYVVPVNMKGRGQPQSPQGVLVRTNTEPKPLIEQQTNGEQRRGLSRSV